MTTVREEEKEGSAPPIAQGPEITAQSRACARASLPLPSPASLESATQRVQALHRTLAWMARQAHNAGQLPGWTIRQLDRPGSLVHAHPPAFARSRELHHEAAGRHDIPALRVLRLAWGYFHLIVVKPPLNFLEWVTETPLRFFGALTLALIFYFWS